MSRFRTVPGALSGAGAFRATFRIPAGVQAGAHHIVIEGIDAAGNPRTVSIPVTIAANSGGATPVPTTEDPAPIAATAGVSPSRRPAALAMTGSNTAELVASALALLLVGALLAGPGRRRTVRRSSEANTSECSVRQAA